MYTITNHTQFIDKTKGLRIVDVTFSDETDSFVKRFQFDLSTSESSMKATVNAFLDKINTPVQDLPDFNPDAPTPKTNRDKWWEDYETLRQIDELITHGVLEGTEKPVTDLRAKVKANFLPEYIT